MAVLENLLVNLGFVVETKEINKFNKSLSRVKKTMLEVGAAATAMGALIFESARRFGEASEKLALNADRAGLTTKAYQEMAGAASLAGINSDQFTASLQQFNFNVGQASIGMGQAIRVFGLMGISVQDANGNIKDTTTLLDQVAGKLKTFSKARQISFAQQLGFTRDSVKFLLMGSKRIGELKKQVEATGSVLSKEAIEKGEQFAEKLKLVGLQVKGVKDKIQEALIPTVLELSNSFEKWFNANKKVIQQNLSDALVGIGKALSILVSVGGKLFKVIQLIAKPLGGVANLAAIFIGIFAVSKLKTIALAMGKMVIEVINLGKAFLAFDFIGALSSIAAGIKAIGIALFTLDFAALPIGVIIGLFVALGAAIFLIANDIMVFSEGGDSVLGRLAKRFHFVKAAIDDVVAAFKDLMSIFKASEKISNKVADFVALAPKKGADAGQAAKQEVGGSGFLNTITFGLAKTIANNSLVDKLVGIKPNQNIAAQPPVPAQTQSTSNSNQSQSTTVNANITVNGSGDPEKIGQVITKHINNMARQTQRDLSSPVVG